MKLARFLVALALLVMPIAFAFQAGQDPPDDPNPEWPGQKASCNNFHDTPHKCQCAKAQQTDCKHEPSEEDYSGNDGKYSRCFTWCRQRTNCHCGGSCST